MRWKTAAITCAAVAALVSWRLVVELRQPPPPAPPAIRLALAPPDGTVLGAADEPLDAAVSPTNDEVVFVATVDGVSRLWRRALSSDRATPLAGTESASSPTWIAGQRAVSFFVGSSLRQTNLDLGATTRITDVADAAGAAWAADGSVLVGHLRGPIERWRDGRAMPATTLAAGDAAHRFPVVVDERTWLYLAERADGRRVLRLVRPDGERDLTDADGHGVVAAGWLLYARGGALLAQRIAADTGALEGRAQALVTGVGVSPIGRTYVAASPRVVLTAPPSDRRYQLQWFDRAGTGQEVVSEPGDYWQVRLSPNDQQVAVTMLEPLLRTLDVYVLRSGAGSPEPVTLGLAADTDPVWSPDGATLLFRSIRSGQAQLFTRRVGVPGASEEPVAQAQQPGAIGGVPSDWTRASGGTIVYGATPEGRSHTDVFQLNAATRATGAVVATGFNESDARLSPDGRWLAYVSDESGQPEVYVSGWPTGPRARVSHAGGRRPRWSGTSVYFLRGVGELLRADRQTGSTPVFSVPERVLSLPSVRDFDVAHGNGRLLAVVPAASTGTRDVDALLDWHGALMRSAK